MVKERESTCKSSSSSDSSSYSSYSSQTSLSSLSSTSSSSGTRGHKRHRSKSQATKIRKTSKRESRKKHHKDEHVHGKSRGPSKKKRKHNHMEAYCKSDCKKRRKRSKDSDQEKTSQDECGRLHPDTRRKHKHQEGHSKGKERTNNLLEAAMSVQEQQKAMIRRNAEIAKARLASGELQRAREEQSKMYQLYGTVDWRAKKKLRTEKKKLEKTVAAGKKLAFLEEREYARMDAFRVALGLPTAEAQRQAEWRAEATQALFELESGQKQAGNDRPKRSKLGLIGPSLPP